MNTLSSQNRRQHLRRSVVSNIQLEHDVLGKTVGVSVNISDSGMLILVDALIQQAFPEASPIKLQLLDSINPELTFTGRVVRNSNHGLGVQLQAYEFHGESYPISELRRQWFVSQDDYFS